MSSNHAPSTVPRLEAWRRRASASSPEVKALTALLCGAAACLAVGVALPMSARTPRVLGLMMLVGAVGLAGLTLLLGDRARRGALCAEAGLIAILNTVLVACAHTTGGAVADGFAYVWLTIYVAVFFPSWWAPFAALVTAGFGVGLLASGLSGLFAAWIVFSLSVIPIAGVLARVSGVLLGRATTDELTGARSTARLLPRVVSSINGSCMASGGDVR